MQCDFYAVCKVIPGRRIENEHEIRGEGNNNTDFTRVEEEKVGLRLIDGKECST